MPTITALGVLLGLILGVLGPRASLAQGMDVGTGEVTIRSRWLGVGGGIRPGDWAGIQLIVNDSADRQREVLVRLTIPDADGDRVLYERALTTNPGVPQPLWTFVRIPTRFKAGDQIHVTAFAAIEQAGEAIAVAGDRRWSYGTGRLLGAERLLVTANDLVERRDGMIGIVGQRLMGLTRYQGDPSESYMRGGHERTRLLAGIRPEELPDRWMGLMPFDTIVWSEAPPASMGTERAQAMREWVHRGGHLVVVLPRIGQTWTDEVNNPLFDITPRVRAERREAVDLSPYAVLITRSAEAVMPRAEILHTFRPLSGAAPEEAVPILAGPGGGEGEWIVVRRIVGTGMVTLIGLDVASAAMTRNDWPEPELFWHRILGRRGEPRRLNEAERSRGLYSARTELTLDRDIRGEIAKTGAASGGVLIGFVVFVAYWLLAGPLGYAVLNRTGNRRHAWVAFVLSSAAFTAIAWGGARAIRPARIETSNLTFLEHVYGQPTDRARSWVSLLVPEYGEAAIAVGDPAQPPGRFVNTIAPWDPDESSGDGFPDSRSYRIESRRPDLVVIPTRATVKQFQIDWAGGPPWSMPRPLPAADGGEGKVRVVEREGRAALSGVLTHDLPGTLRDVFIVVNFGQRDLLRSFAGPGARSMTADAAVYLISEWAPATGLDLSRLDIVRDKLDTFKELIDRSGPGDQQVAGLDRSRIPWRMAAVALYPQLFPPDARPPDTWRGGDSEWAAMRKFTHGWDLGEWFTQPSIILIGQLSGDGADSSPVPLYVGRGGEFRPVRQVGRTVVRWVYPLPARPPVFGAMEVEASPGPGQQGP
jgi:hypothetical protein